MKQKGKMVKKKKKKKRRRRRRRKLGSSCSHAILYGTEYIQ
jgi:hypothetical protein